MPNIRLAQRSDYAFLLQLEQNAFTPPFRASPASLKRSLESPHQRVFIISKDDVAQGAAIVFCYKKTLRLYSLAIVSAVQGQNYGRALVTHVLGFARQQNYTKITLEANKNNPRLLAFYTAFGFKVVQDLPAYYGPRTCAVRMVKVLQVPPVKKKFQKNIVVTTKHYPWLAALPGIEVVSAHTFLSSDSPYNGDEYRVFNFANNMRYQSLGYYVSLLARARNMRVVPTVSTLEDVAKRAVLTSIGAEVFALMQKSLERYTQKEVYVRALFGVADAQSLQKLISALLRYFEAPLIAFTFKKRLHWELATIKLLALDDVLLDEMLVSKAQNYFSQNRFAVSAIKQYKYDLAILVDENELTPPSDKMALRYFKEAAESIGFYTEFITKNDYHRLSQFDALFIRANTDVHNFTYKFARLAYAEGLIVIDDPWSILQCSNKLYFHESMNKINVQTPKTMFVSRKTKITTIISTLGLPLVLKQPDSASSLGVFKINNEEELKTKLAKLFTKSALIIAQAFLQTDFDWRVGVMDGEALYVCKYYMAKNHWQIFHWQNDHKTVSYGRVLTLAVESAPPGLVALARKAASRFGTGLYGVDIKEHEGAYYVVEVNDNPSIDRLVEDRVLGKKLYIKIMQNIFNRITKARRT